MNSKRSSDHLHSQRRSNVNSKLSFEKHIDSSKRLAGLSPTAAAANGALEFVPLLAGGDDENTKSLSQILFSTINPIRR